MINMGGYMSRSDFILRHRWDGWFWAIFMAVGVVAIAQGFGGAVQRRFSGEADYQANWPLIIHVWSVGAWLVLLSVQAALISARRVQWHRRLGRTLLALVPVVVISGFWAEMLSERFWEARYPDYVRFLMVPIFQMGGFGLFAILAWRYRKRQAAHKRLIFLATASLVAAAFGRAWGESIVDPALAGAPPLLRDWVGYHFGFIFLGLLACFYDLATRRTIHPALSIGVSVVAAAMLAGTYASQSSWWPDLARTLIAFEVVSEHSVSGGGPT